MGENVTEASHAERELCRILKTVRMIEQSANNSQIIKKKKKVKKKVQQPTCGICSDAVFVSCGPSTFELKSWSQSTPSKGILSTSPKREPSLRLKRLRLQPACAFTAFSEML